MARPDFRELLAWALFATVTVVHLHSRTQLELCFTQLESSRAKTRGDTTFPFVENGGSSERSNASLPDELPDGTSGRTFRNAISCSARMERQHPLASFPLIPTEFGSALPSNPLFLSYH
jgi:hypothetical protein